MAKKRKKQEQLKAEKDWTPPEFDRAEYMRSEIDVAKATMIAAVLAVPFAVIALYVLPVGGAGGGLLVGLAGIPLLYFIYPFFKIDPKSMKATQWLGSISTYFFLLLAVWILLMNPPFNDFASPAIMDGRVSWDRGESWVNVTVNELGTWEVEMPSNISSNATMIVQARITDNAELNHDTVTLRVGSGEPVGMTETGNNIFRYEVQDPGAGMFFEISAADINGNEASRPLRLA